MLIACSFLSFKRRDLSLREADLSVALERRTYHILCVSKASGKQ